MPGPSYFSDTSVIHQIILSLGQQGDGGVSLKDLKTYLVSKKVYLGKAGLLKKITKHGTLLRVEDEDVSLCQLDAEFMQDYCQLAKMERMESSYLGRTRCSLNEKTSFEFSDVMRVTGLICAASNARKESCVHLVFGNTYYKIASPLAREFQQRQKLEAVLCFRKQWQQYCLVVILIFLALQSRSVW